MAKVLWQGYDNKVKYDKVIQEYEVGGLKFVDLKTRNEALKMSWVERLNVKVTENEDTSFIYLPLPIKDALIWKCNTSNTDVKKIVQKNNLLSLQTWELWSKFHYHTPTNFSEVKRQVLWCNSHIKRANVMWYIPMAHEVGLDTVGDLFDYQNAHFLNA